jgi:hypothetical protein
MNRPPRKYYIDPLTATIPAVINQIIKDWPDKPRINGSVDQVRIFAGGLMYNKNELSLIAKRHAYGYKLTAILVHPPAKPEIEPTNL